MMKKIPSLKNSTALSRTGRTFCQWNGKSVTERGGSDERISSRDGARTVTKNVFKKVNFRKESQFGILAVKHFLLNFFFLLQLVKSLMKEKRLKKEMKEEIRMTMKIAAIVLTDFFCWCPIILLGTLVQLNVLILPPSVFAWCVMVFQLVQLFENEYVHSQATWLRFPD